MQTASLVLFWLAFALYIGATVLYAYQFVVRNAAVTRAARLLTGIGLALHTASIGANSIAHGTTPYTSANLLVLGAWALVLLYFLVEHVLRIKTFGVFLIPAAVVLMAIAQITSGTNIGYSLASNQMRLIEGYGVGLHVALVVFANAAFVIGGLATALYLYQDRQLKRLTSTALSRRLPPLTTLQTVARRAIAFGFPVYTAGITLGVIRAIEADVAGWWADPRIIVSGIVWLTFGIYLLLFTQRSVSSRTMSAFSLAGLALVVILGVLARTVPVGFHVFAV